MARILWILRFLALICSPPPIHGAASIRPISEAHRSAALELFTPIDGSYPSLEENYEALRTFQILGLEKAADMTGATCPVVIEKLGSSASSIKDIFHTLRVNSILKCQIDAETIEDTISKLQAVVKNADSLLDFYYSIQSLFQIKVLSQSDGRWQYDSSGTVSSTYAAGIELETLAGVVSLADSELDQSIDFLGLVEKFDYLSGKYDIELTVGDITMLMRLGINLKGFPSSAAPAAFSILFHSGIAAILLLYALFWLKLNLFTTLKVLGFLGTFLVFVGHRTLSHLASSSGKPKSS